MLGFPDVAPPHASDLLLLLLMKLFNWVGNEKQQSSTTLTIGRHTPEIHGQECLPAHH